MKTFGCCENSKLLVLIDPIMQELEAEMLMLKIT